MEKKISYSFALFFDTNLLRTQVNHSETWLQTIASKCGNVARGTCLMTLCNSIKSPCYLSPSCRLFSPALPYFLRHAVRKEKKQRFGRVRVDHGVVLYSLYDPHYCVIGTWFCVVLNVYCRVCSLYCLLYNLVDIII